jgi:ABC-type Na+ efflux pump permease subunit
MKGMNQAWLVAAREFRERSRSRGFLASVALMVIAVAAAIVLPALLDTGPGTKDVGLTGAVPAELPAAIESQGTAVGTRPGSIDSTRSPQESKRSETVTSTCWSSTPDSLSGVDGLTNSSRLSLPAPSSSMPYGNGPSPPA